MFENAVVEKNDVSANSDNREERDNTSDLTESESKESNKKSSLLRGKLKDSGLKLEVKGDVNEAASELLECCLPKASQESKESNPQAKKPSVQIEVEGKLVEEINTQKAVSKGFLNGAKTNLGLNVKTSGDVQAHVSKLKCCNPLLTPAATSQSTSTPAIKVEVLDQSQNTKNRNEESRDTKPGSLLREMNREVKLGKNLGLEVQTKGEVVSEVKTQPDCCDKDKQNLSQPIVTPTVVDPNKAIEANIEKGTVSVPPRRDEALVEKKAYAGTDRSEPRRRSQEVRSFEKAQDDVTKLNPIKRIEQIAEERRSFTDSGFVKPNIDNSRETFRQKEPVFFQKQDSPLNDKKEVRRDLQNSRDVNQEANQWHQKQNFLKEKLAEEASRMRRGATEQASYRAFEKPVVRDSALRKESNRVNREREHNASSDKVVTSVKAPSIEKTKSTNRSLAYHRNVKVQDLGRLVQKNSFTYEKGAIFKRGTKNKRDKREAQKSVKTRAVFKKGNSDIGRRTSRKDYNLSKKEIVNLNSSKKERVSTKKTTSLLNIVKGKLKGSINYTKKILNLKEPLNVNVSSVKKGVVSRSIQHMRRKLNALRVSLFYIQRKLNFKKINAIKNNISISVLRRRNIRLNKKNQQRKMLFKQYQKLITARSKIRIFKERLISKRKVANQDNRLRVMDVLRLRNILKRLGVLSSRDMEPKVIRRIHTLLRTKNLRLLRKHFGIFSIRYQKLLKQLSLEELRFFMSLVNNKKVKKSKYHNLKALKTDSEMPSVDEVRDSNESTIHINPGESSVITRNGEHVRRT